MSQVETVHKLVGIGNDQEFLTIEDTRYLQVASLVKFMKLLGYNYSNGGFRAYIPEAVHMNRVSLETAQQWHNNNFKKVTYPFIMRRNTLAGAAKELRLPVARMQAAIDSKRVVRTKLQYSKKREELIVVDHQVKYIKENLV